MSWERKWAKHMGAIYYGCESPRSHIRTLWLVHSEIDENDITAMTTKHARSEQPTSLQKEISVSEQWHTSTMPLLFRKMTAHLSLYLTRAFLKKATLPTFSDFSFFRAFQAGFCPAFRNTGNNKKEQGRKFLALDSARLVSAHIHLSKRNSQFRSEVIRKAAT